MDGDQKFELLVLLLVLSFVLIGVGITGLVEVSKQKSPPVATSPK